MRELKFRAWVINTTEYLEWDGMYGIFNAGAGKAGVHVAIADQCFYGADEVILEQFTGLHDKNGKEIYEGDIVKYGNDKPLEIFYKESCFCYNQNSKYISRLQIFDNQNNLEVVGNIHENPELLEATNGR